MGRPDSSVIVLYGQILLLPSTTYGYTYPLCIRHMNVANADITGAMYIVRAVVTQSTQCVIDAFNICNDDRVQYILRVGRGKVSQLGVN